MRLTNDLFFEARAAQAFGFHARCLGGRITTSVTFGEMPGCEHMPPELKRLTAHVRLDAHGSTLMGSDWCPPDGGPHPGIHGNRGCPSVDDPGEAERLFAALSEAGEVMMPLTETSWSLRFGMFTDRFGAHWMVDCSRPATERAQPA